MDRSETDERAGTGRTARALIVAGPTEGGGCRVRGGRPLAGFLTQLMVGADPALRPARAERTGRAAGLYARVGSLSGRD